MSEIPTVAQKRTIRMAISRTRREIADPAGITGIKPKSLTNDPERRWSIEEMRKEARARMDVLEALL